MLDWSHDLQFFLDVSKHFFFGNKTGSMIRGDLDDVICPKQNDKEGSNSNFHPHQDLLFIF